MKLFKLKKTFVEDEDGAVTVDWVVLTAAIVGIAVAVLALIRNGVNKAATDIYNELTKAIVGG
jgi:Flp pilus assembly pilin Flp